MLHKKTIIITLFILAAIAGSAAFLYNYEQNYQQEKLQLRQQIFELEHFKLAYETCLETNCTKVTDKTPSDATQTVLPSTVIMNIPVYRQSHSASCELASTHAAIKYYGVNITENDIIKAVGEDKLTMQYDSDGNIKWGDPQKMFVGTVDAKQVYYDGYGVYNKPIYNFLKANGFAASISKTGWKLEELYNELKKGRPVIAWITSDFSTQPSKKMISPDGVESIWKLREHAVVLRGVDDNNVYFMDVGNGTNRQVSK